MDNSKIDLEATLKRVLEQDEAAASMLLDYIHPLVMKIVWRRCPAGVPEEDMAQEIYAKIFKNLKQFQGKAHFNHWVSKIAVNTCITHLIKAKARQKELRRSDLTEEQDALLDAAIADESITNPADRIAALELLGKLMGRLDPKDRLILELKELQHKSVKEISQITGWSGVNVRVRAMRAKAKLKAYWVELLDSERL